MVAAFQPPPQRMTLGSVRSTRQPDRPLRAVVYGVAGVGKSSFAAAAPSPIFICGEDGAGFLDVQGFPKPLGWYDVLDAIGALTNGEHNFQTLVIDTLDGIEPLCADHVCRTNGGKKNLEDFGFGKGHVLAQEEWRRFLTKLEGLQQKRGMHVVLLAHAISKEHKDPEHEQSWKRWTPKLHAKLAEATSEWTDALLFATHEAVAKKDGFKVRGIATGERLLHTEWTGAHDAKNRLGLPPTLPLDWSAFWLAAQPALRPATPAPDPEVVARELRILKTDLATLIPQLDADAAIKAQGALDGAGDDLPKLRKIKARVDALLTSATATV